MKTFTLGLVLACQAYAAPDAKLVLPVAPHARITKREGPSVSVTLMRGGIIEIEPRRFLFDPKGLELPDRQRLSLDGLSTRLVESRRMFEMRERSHGRSSYVRSDGFTSTRLVVNLKVDKDVPALHVFWVLLVLAEQKFIHVAIAATTAASMEYSEREAAELGVSRKKVPTAGTLLVTMPTKFHDKQTLIELVAETGRSRARCLAGGTAIAIEKLSALLRKTKTRHVQLQCSRAIPFKVLVLVLDQVAAAGIGGPSWMQHEYIPTGATRAAKVLPRVDDKHD